MRNSLGQDKVTMGPTLLVARQAQMDTPKVAQTTGRPFKSTTNLELERSPEEAALVMRLRIFTTMRWFAVLGVIAATVLAQQAFHIFFPVLPVYVICAFMAVYNFVLFRQVGGLQAEKPGQVVREVRNYGYIHISLDLVTLTALLHFTGGIENPFVFFFVFHIIAASIVLSYRAVYLLATLAIAMVIILIGLEYSGVIQHVTLEDFVTPALYREPAYILAVVVALGVLLYGTAYMATAVSGELRKRQREVVQLSRELLDEKTGELERASSEVAKLEEEKSRFLRFIGIAAHDLKAPLAAIQGFIWVMLGGYAGELNEKQKNMMERSTHRITELLSLISDLLDIPRIETGQIVPEMEDVSLRKVIEDTVELQRNLAKGKGIKLKSEVPHSLPRIRGSSTRLQQVITNLLSNAINYTAEGTVTIRARDRANDLLVEVLDTGIGIPSADLPRLFEDFFRASNVEQRSGTGLGLAITRRIVEAHGGKIWAESPSPETGHGSQFSFTLPKLTLPERSQTK